MTDVQEKLHGHFHLVGDIGGSNARLALVEPQQNEVHETREFPCDAFENLTAVIEHYLSGLEVPRPTLACLAVAAPITGDRVRFTNRDWRFSIEDLRKTLGFNSLYVLNDFLALAHALPLLEPADLHDIGPSHLKPNIQKPMVVMGPGTGLGVAALVPDTATGRFIALATQGGHLGFAPADELEIRILEKLQQRYKRISAEHLLSGRGLCDLYATMIELGAIDGSPVESASEITTRLKQGNVGARVCIDRFCAILGSLAGDLAMVYGAHGGVFIGGGIIHHFLDVFIQSGFRQRFEAKGAMHDYVASIPTKVITAATPALTGAAAYLQQVNTT